MGPRLIQFKCPCCEQLINPIPADMGDKTMKCHLCGKYICYKWREQKVEIATRPKRNTSSGLVF